MTEVWKTSGIVLPLGGEVGRKKKEPMWFVMANRQVTSQSGYFIAWALLP